MRISDWSSDVCSSDLVLRFDKPSRCIIVAQYDGDRIALAGAVDLECDTLCQERASFAGVAVPRVSDSQAAALSASGWDGKPLRSEEHTSVLQSLMRTPYAVLRL